MIYMIYGDDSAKIKEAVAKLPKGSKVFCKHSNYFDGALECDEAIVTCGNKDIIEAYGDKVKSAPKKEAPAKDAEPKKEEPKAKKKATKEKAK